MSPEECSEPLLRHALDAEEVPSRAVYSVIATLEDCSPLDLTPLGEAIDPDALDALFADGGASNEYSFSYCGYSVTVTSNEVRVMDSEEE